MSEPTKNQIKRFVQIRNKSGFSSNLQFSIDAREAGFDVSDLGDAVKRDEGGYLWATAHGKLVEHPNGQMELVEGR